MAEYKRQVGRLCSDTKNETTMELLRQAMNGVASSGLLAKAGIDELAPQHISQGRVARRKLYENSRTLSATEALVYVKKTRDGEEYITVGGRPVESTPMTPRAPATVTAAACRPKHAVLAKVDRAASADRRSIDDMLCDHSPPPDYCSLVVPEPAEQNPQTMACGGPADAEPMFNCNKSDTGDSVSDSESESSERANLDFSFVATTSPPKPRAPKRKAEKVEDEVEPLDTKWLAELERLLHGPDSDESAHGPRLLTGESCEDSDGPTAQWPERASAPLEAALHCGGVAVASSEAVCESAGLAAEPALAAATAKKAKRTAAVLEETASRTAAAARNATTVNKATPKEDTSAAVHTAGTESESSPFITRFEVESYLRRHECTIAEFDAFVRFRLVPAVVGGCLKLVPIIGTVPGAYGVVVQTDRSVFESWAIDKIASLTLDEMAQFKMNPNLTLPIIIDLCD